MHRRALYIPTLLLAGIFCSAANPTKTPDTSGRVPVPPGASPSLALSPGVLEVKT